MKKNYTTPEISIASVSAADVITASAAFLGADGVIELSSYGFDGGDIGGGF
ncbi:MAG: hypothetical protein IJ011_05675 [Clostridia bacterium]|nr:hypothetical protein [Clostridia bacterium]